jgi:hypothetical protein
MLSYGTRTMRQHEDRPALPMTPSSQQMEPPETPVRFKRARSTCNACAKQSGVSQTRTLVSSSVTWDLSARSRTAVRGGRCRIAERLGWRLCGARVSGPEPAMVRYRLGWSFRFLVAIHVVMFHAISGSSTSASPHASPFTTTLPHAYLSVTIQAHQTLALFNTPSSVATNPGIRCRHPMVSCYRSAILCDR